MQKLKVGIIGCGSIGTEIARSLVTILKDRFELKALYDIDAEKMRKLGRLLKKKITARSMEEVFKKSDLIVECASGDAAEAVLKKAIETRKAVMIMSIGGLVGAFSLLEKARKMNIKVYFPSGAICGLDGLKAAKLSKLERVTLTTKKPPKGLEGAPFLKEKNIDINSIKGETVLFDGSAREAIKGFPKNVNVASILSLAGLGDVKTTVRVITSPKWTKNTHEVKISGDFGEITTLTENVPSRENPKTSMLASLSAIATLKGIAESVRFGT